MSDKVSDEKPWPLFGYAPGYYMCKCSVCSKQFEGDKRAVMCIDCAASTAKAELLALRAQQQAAGWRVKKLAWSEITAPREDGPGEPTGEFEALCVFGGYSVTIDADEDLAASPFCVWSPEDNLGHFASADEAKAAAQSDYAARINSAIEPASVPDGYVMVPDATHASNARGPVNCNIVLRHQNKAMPRTCQRCGLGPCPFYRNDGRPISASGRDGE